MSASDPPVEGGKNMGLTQARKFRILGPVSQAFPLVSIVVPVYQVEPYIAECVRSVLAQDYPALELILVDDCGGDRSVEIACELLEASSLRWTLLRHERNRGLSAARNTGAAQAEGDYLFFVDSDDYLAPDCLSRLVREAERTGAEMVFGNYLEDREGVFSPGYATRSAEALFLDSPVATYMAGLVAPMAWNRLLLNRWYQQSGIRFVEGILYEDEPWTAGLMFQCSSIARVNEITYYYRWRTRSIMGAPRCDEKYAEARVLWMQVLARQMAMHGDKLAEGYILWHHKKVLRTLREFRAELKLAKPERYARALLKCLSVLSWRNLRRIPWGDNRLFYVMRLFLPVSWAYGISSIFTEHLRKMKRHFLSRICRKERVEPF